MNEKTSRAGRIPKKKIIINIGLKQNQFGTKSGQQNQFGTKSGSKINLERKAGIQNTYHYKSDNCLILSRLTPVAF